MPNIEIHGLRHAPQCKVYLAVRKLLEGAYFEKDIVFTLCDDTVLDMKGRVRPFFRIVSSPVSADEVNIILELLLPFNLDIELQVIELYTRRKGEESLRNW